jgi:Uma2 family endonuclease
MAATTLLTSDQFLALPEEFDPNGNRIKTELIGGEIVPMAFPSLLHDVTKNRISKLLDRFFESNPELRFVSLVEIGTLVSDLDAFAPDVSVTSLQRLSGAGRIFQGAPEIAIEVVSPTDTVKHLKHKVHAYLRGGARCVWVVYPETKSVEIYREGIIHELTGDQPITDPLLPGFSSPVSAFFTLT